MSIRHKNFEEGDELFEEEVFDLDIASRFLKEEGDPDPEEDPLFGLPLGVWEETMEEIEGRSPFEGEETFVLVDVPDELPEDYILLDGDGEEED